MSYIPSHFHRFKNEELIIYITYLACRPFNQILSTFVQFFFRKYQVTSSELSKILIAHEINIVLDFFSWIRVGFVNPKLLILVYADLEQDWFQVFSWSDQLHLGRWIETLYHLMHFFKIYIISDKIMILVISCSLLPFLQIVQVTFFMHILTNIFKIIFLFRSSRHFYKNKVSLKDDYFRK